MRCGTRIPGLARVPRHPAGLPVLLLSPSFVHANVNTPAAPPMLALLASRPATAFLP